MSPRTRIACAPRAGTTLIEVLLVSVVLAVVIGAVAMVSRANERAFRAGATAAQLEEQAAAAVARIVAELRIAGGASLDVDAAAVEYVQAEGLSGSAVVWGGLRRIERELEIGEVDDGLDNNGNGLIDEGRLILTEDVGGAAERSRVLTRWVRELAAGEVENGLDDNGDGVADEPGFALARAGDTLRIRLTLEQADASGRLLSRTATTSTHVRN